LQSRVTRARFEREFIVWEHPRSLYLFLSLCGKQWVVSTGENRARRLVPLILGLVTLADVALLFVQDAAPGLFPAESHALLASSSLAMIAFTYLIFQAAQRPAAKEIVKATLLAAAFLFWAANQLWPNLPLASLFNDVAIGLFVLDVFLVIAGRPSASNVCSFAEGGAGGGSRRDGG
jgi:hypothetical protein